MLYFNCFLYTLKIKMSISTDVLNRNQKDKLHYLECILNIFFKQMIYLLSELIIWGELNKNGEYQNH